MRKNLKKLMITILMLFIISLLLNIANAETAKAKSGKHLSISRTSITLFILNGDTQSELQYNSENTYYLELRNVTSTPKWTSSNNSVAKVSKHGTVTPVKAGMATITAKSGKESVKCKVYVKNKPDSEQMLKSIEITKEIYNGYLYVKFNSSLNYETTLLIASLNEYNSNGKLISMQLPGREINLNPYGSGKLILPLHGKDASYVELEIWGKPYYCSSFVHSTYDGLKNFHQVLLDPMKVSVNLNNVSLVKEGYTELHFEITADNEYDFNSYATLWVEFYKHGKPVYVATTNEICISPGKSDYGTGDNIIKTLLRDDIDFDSYQLYYTEFTKHVACND